MRTAVEHVDPDWPKYPDTILHFRTEPPVRIDLRQPVDEQALAQLRDLGFEIPFAVLTAHDPRGQDESAAVNAQRATQLDSRLAALGAKFVHVDACSPDGSHCEDSVASVIDCGVATDLAREFEQVAIFWFDGEKFWILGTLVGTDPIMLPRAV